MIPHAALVARLAADRAPSLVGHTEEKREVCPAHGWVGRVAFERDHHDACRPLDGVECHRCKGRRIVMGDFCSRCDGAGVEPPEPETPEREPEPERHRLVAVPGFELAPREGQWKRSKRIAERSQSIAPHRITQASLRDGAAELAGVDVDALLADRPRTRGECVDGPRPCRFIACRHHLFLDINPQTGSIKFNFPGADVDDMIESCSLDIADRGEHILDDLANLMNVTSERIRQLEQRAKFDLIAALKQQRITSGGSL